MRTISQVAELTGISTRTLQLYTAKISAFSLTSFITWRQQHLSHITKGKRHSVTGAFPTINAISLPAEFLSKGKTLL